MTKEHSLLFEKGLLVYQEFFEYKAMQESAKNWLFSSKYRFSTGSFYGCHDGLQLTDMQFGHAHQYEGILFEGYSPKDCLTIAVIQENYSVLCMNNIKMNLHDIITLDDTKAYDFISSGRVKVAIISIKKSTLLRRIPHILSIRNFKFKDIKNLLSDTIEREWNLVLNNKNILTQEDHLDSIEERIIKALVTTFTNNPAEVSHLTNGEKTAIEIKSYLLNSLEKNISVEEVARKFNISEKTFQNSFKSMYGMTPKYFIQKIKLNKAHEDLLSNKQDINVSNIAMKWGFTHFGRFSKYYKDVFGTLPSETLKNNKLRFF